MCRFNTPPCVHSKRPRVCRQHAHTCKQVWSIVSSVFTHMAWKATTSSSQGLALSRSPSNSVGTRRPSTHLWRFSKVSFWRWRFQATDIVRSFRPNTLTCPQGSCTPVLACVSCLNCSGQRSFWPAPRPHSVCFAHYRRAFCFP